ncbi:MAG: TIGR04376 family protein [Synechococcaceae cyanobacterium RL_1_2]|nr:TIGR04376 family protein [Synechococcaceae cyanobacterium RL_1_2]
MGLFDFIENRLDEFLKNNPHLELQALEEQLQEQAQDTKKLINQLEIKGQNLQQQILDVAKDIQDWHSRGAKAKAAGRLDLAAGAQEREEALLRQGNLHWGQMEVNKQQLAQAQTLFKEIKDRQDAVNRKKIELKQQQPQVNVENHQSWETATVNTDFTSNRGGLDPLLEQFQRWEMDEELRKMKKIYSSFVIG